MTKRSVKRYLREGNLDAEAFEPDTKVRRLWQRESVAAKASA